MIISKGPYLRRRGKQVSPQLDIPDKEGSSGDGRDNNVQNQFQHSLEWVTKPLEVGGLTLDAYPMPLSAVTTVS